MLSKLLYEKYCTDLLCKERYGKKELRHDILSHFLDGLSYGESEK